MDQFLASLPKSFIAIVAIVITLLVLRQWDPPRTVCDTQIEYFKDAQKKFLYPESTSSEVKKQALVKTLFETCNNENNPGGCFEYFESIKKMLTDLKNVPEQCSEAIGEVPEVQQWTWKTLRLMVQMAWGPKPPISYIQKNGWFDSSELSLYCGLRQEAIRIYGREKYGEWQEQMLQSMPGAEKLDRNQIWQRHLLSTPCDLYK
jgi:hypothetical protein